MSSLYTDPGRRATGQKVALCTTAYDSPSPGYVFSIQRSRQALEDAGIATAYCLLSGNCHVDDSRNAVVHEFLYGELSDCTDLVFLDADVVWEPEALVELCQYDVDLVGGVYPFRRDDEKSKENMPVITIPGVVEPDSLGLLEVAGLPTGFMRIRRHVLETLAADACKHWGHNDRKNMVAILFERTFDPTPENPKVGGRWGGDLSFCRKWHEKGGKLYAAAELNIGHTVKSVVYDSLAAALRRQGGETIRYMADRVRRNDFTPELFVEARRAVGNKWGALEDVLTMCAALGRKADGPIIETGTGLSSIVLAASTDQPVICLEHDPFWARQVYGMAKQAGVENIDVRLCDIRDRWYEVPKDLPSQFALGLNDGPPRTLGSRMGFFDHFGDTPAIICDDADDHGYGEALSSWCSQKGRRIDFVERSAVIR